MKELVSKIVFGLDTAAKKGEKADVLNFLCGMDGTGAMTHEIGMAGHPCQ